MKSFRTCFFVALLCGSFAGLSVDESISKEVPKETKQLSIRDKFVALLKILDTPVIFGVGKSSRTAFPLTVRLEVDKEKGIVTYSADLDEGGSISVSHFERSINNPYSATAMLHGDKEADIYTGLNAGTIFERLRKLYKRQAK